LISWLQQAHLQAISLRRLALGLVVALVLGTFATRAEAKYAAIVLDADTGEIIHETNADAQTYPASLTKMMTLYLLFEALESGKLKLDQQLPVSLHAANRAPSKLGLIAGETVAVRDVILGLVTKSANDAASVAAEALGGTETGFADKMTQKAQKLGMPNTVFRNASGLPDPKQHTTARDIAKLARALYRDFPKQYRYFATAQFTYNGRSFANHNHLMSRFEGMDGIKTGFINASGFNLAASAVRDNRRLIGVVMGGQSARSRDDHMAALLNAAFAGRRSAPSTMIASAEEPGETTAETTEGAIVKRAARGVRSLSPVSRAEASTLTASKAGAAAAERWSIQLGAYSKQAAAEKAGSNALTKLKMKGKSVHIAGPEKGDKEKLWRARVVNFSKKEAQSACRTLHKRHLSCAVLGPSAVKVAAGS
jgi:D-alanyl-D-alanine carboxypeptidase